jgi:hypothetical protein
VSYKAKSTFSFDGKVYNEGDAVNVTDEVALDVLKRRGHIVEGKGKEAAKPEGELMSETVEKRRFQNDMPEKKEVVVQEKANRVGAAGQKVAKKAAKKK